MRFFIFKCFINRFFIYAIFSLGTNSASCYCVDNKTLIKNIKDLGNDERYYGSFVRQPVLPLKEVSDHQSHIISKDQIALMMLPDHNKFIEKLKSIVVQTQDIKNQYALLQEHFEDSWGDYSFSKFVNYKVELLYFDSIPSEILGPLYSSIMWNPANICRAPSDDYRGKYPDNNLDKVSLYALVENENFSLLIECAHEDNPAIFMETWKTLKDSWSKDNPSTGYYQFDWQKDGNIYTASPEVKNYAENISSMQNQLDWNDIQKIFNEYVDRYHVEISLGNSQVVNDLLSKNIEDWSRLFSEDFKFKQDVRENIGKILNSALASNDKYGEVARAMHNGSALDKLVRMEVTEPLLKRAWALNEEGKSYISEVVAKFSLEFIQHDRAQKGDVTQRLESERKVKEETILEIEKQKRSISEITDELSKIEDAHGDEDLQKKNELKEKVKDIKAELEKEESKLKDAERVLEYDKEGSADKYKEKAEEHIKERDGKIFRAEK